MNTFNNTKNKINPRNILGGGIGFFDETESERESTIVSAAASTVGSAVTEALTQTAVSVYEAVVGLGQSATGKESKSEANGNGKFSIDDSIDFTQEAQIQHLQKQKEDMDKKREADRQRVFNQTLTANLEKVRREQKEQLEREIDDIVTNLPTEQKNQLLHYQAAYKDRSIYQRAELRKKLVEQRKKAEKDQKEASVAATNPKGKFSIGENELSMREGNSMFGGVGDKGGPG